MLLLNGDCLSVMKMFPDNSVDSIVTDPPYGLSFMGRKWDYDVPTLEVWAECLRVLKPGGHLLAFAGTRTQHRMACRIEDGGFEIRDMLAWIYGSGFPKSHNGEWGGTALKPALEPITLARKPLIGTVEANWREHGTGALSIDGCRVGMSHDDAAYIAERIGGFSSTKSIGGNGAYGGGEVMDRAASYDASKGRWPANLLHDGSPEVVALFPGESDKSAARFFYCPKASKGDRGDNSHPTVKPTDLMRYLCRLVTPPGGIVLDPFMGSGSTGKAAKLEGFDFIGIERDPDYFKIAEARCA